MGFLDIWGRFLTYLIVGSRTLNLSWMITLSVLMTYQVSELQLKLQRMQLLCYLYILIADTELSLLQITLVYIVGIMGLFSIGRQNE